MSNKILYSPKECTTGFWGLRDVIYPTEPCDNSLCSCQYNFDKNGFKCEAPHLIKSNKLEIVNPEEVISKFDFIDSYAKINPEFKPGDIFDLPIGYEFKEDTEQKMVETEDQGFRYEYPKVLRLVKTETKEENWNEADEQYLKSIDHHPIAVTYIRSLREEITRLKKQVPQPEPEESQIEVCQKVIDDILKFQSYNKTTEHALNHLIKNFIIQRKKQ